MKIVVSGASDDLVEIDLDGKGMEFPAPPRGYGQMELWRGDFIAPNGEQARVHVFYDGCWHVSAGQVDEEVPFPHWGWTLTQGDRAYVVDLTFYPPDGTRLTNTTTEE
jgi:hypothetical protein